MKKNVIISLADSKYYELLDELVNSIKQFKESENTAICILDAGLTDEQKEKLSLKVDEIKSADWDIEVPDFKVKGREWLKSQVSRAFLPKYFPGYEKYLWIDADAWVNSWDAIELYFKGCENNKLSIATSADRAYGRVLRAEWVFRSFARIKSQNYKHAKSSGFSEKIAREVALKPHLNIGVFALEANAKHWDVWQSNLKKALSFYSDAGGKGDPTLAQAVIPRTDGSNARASAATTPAVHAIIDATASPTLPPTNKPTSGSTESPTLSNSPSASPSIYAPTESLSPSLRPVEGTYSSGAQSLGRGIWSGKFLFSLLISVSGAIFFS